jgi:hypothetical protein
MANERDTEKQRIENLGYPVGFGFLEGEISGDVRYLGAPGDVESIVREFALEVSEIADKANNGVLDQADALAALEASAERYGGIFYGKEPKSFVAMPFNSPAQLGLFIKERLDAEDGVERAAYLLFMNTANQLLEARARYLDGEIGEDDVSFLIESAIDDAVTTLLGLPPTTDGE